MFCSLKTSSMSQRPTRSQPRGNHASCQRYGIDDRFVRLYAFFAQSHHVCVVLLRRRRTQRVRWCASSIDRSKQTANMNVGGCSGIARFRLSPDGFFVDVDCASLAQPAANHAAGTDRAVPCRLSRRFDSLRPLTSSLFCRKGVIPTALQTEYETCNGSILV
jgi:hypothetical protein